ncbi:type II toxin-antitoxin system VapC family toxin [Tsukamurella sp. PLM1]|uniref:type II toxin-antitoxin system VapC family toxin n=1 Tax=Tsukamurella sp. PLM1 TaxID=2929795 RepID=UPI00204E8E96|nr:type II toxin-antitoxin system VapC family toxin [Tsukamurella sp. PLM1]BDH59626.1 ribonuclease VapC [Tsukamurella sp. PLM1]
MTLLALDTSVLVPLLSDWHESHSAARAAVGDEDPAVPAHVLLETFSVLTRIPAPNRISPAAAAGAVEALRLPVIGLPPQEVQSVIGAVGARGVRGGAIYDALVGATAAKHGLILLTRDRRAIQTYEAVGATYRAV